MSKQLRFFGTQSDLSQFLEFAESEGFSVLTEFNKADEIQQPIRPTQYRFRPEDHLFHLMHRDFGAAEAFYVELTGQPELARLMVHVSPVIEVSPSTLVGNRMEDGRIYFGCDQSDPRYEKALSTYRTLERFLRKWPKTQEKKFVAGPDALKEAEQGHIVLTPR